MSHRFPRLVANPAAVSFLNSMHGIRLSGSIPKFAADALPLLALNSVTMLGAELHGRSYGGGVLKMEPSEAACLPVPAFESLHAAWAELGPDRDQLEQALRGGCWTEVVARVDEALLRSVLHASRRDAQAISEAARDLRRQRLGRTRAASSGG